MIMHYILKCVADALFLASLNLGNSNVQFKDIAEVGAAGRYIPSRLACRGQCPHARFSGEQLYTNGVGITLSRSSVQVFLGPKVANEQKSDTPLFFCSIAVLSS